MRDAGVACCNAINFARSAIKTWHKRNKKVALWPSWDRSLLFREERKQQFANEANAAAFRRRRERERENENVSVCALLKRAQTSDMKREERGKEREG